MATRSCKRPIYRHEFTTKQHADLLRIIARLPCMVMISGYYSELYAIALSQWRSVHFCAQTRSGRNATEWLWMNFPEPLELHDYRYLGRNFRERERIKRKRNRWKERLLRMTSLERHAVLMALEEIRISSLPMTIPTWAAPQMAMGTIATTGTSNDSGRYRQK
jgi:hypothetical protein